MEGPRALVLARARTFLDIIKVEHTVFASTIPT